MRKENERQYGITQSPTFNFQKSRNNNSQSTNAFAVTVNVSPPSFLPPFSPIQFPIQNSAQDTLKMKEQDISSLKIARIGRDNADDFTKVVMSMIPALKDKEKLPNSNLAIEEEKITNLKKEKIFGANLDTEFKINEQSGDRANENDLLKPSVIINGSSNEIGGKSVSSSALDKSRKAVFFILSMLIVQIFKAY